MNGVSESEYIIMGQPSALRGLVGKFQKLEGNKIDVQGQIEKAKKAVQESI